MLYVAGDSVWVEPTELETKVYGGLAEVAKLIAVRLSDEGGDRCNIVFLLHQIGTGMGW